MRLVAPHRPATQKVQLTENTQREYVTHAVLNSGHEVEEVEFATLKGKGKCEAEYNGVESAHSEEVWENILTPIRH